MYSIIRYAILIASFCSWLYAQKCDINLSGYVKDFHTNEPLSDTQIFLNDSLVSTTNNSAYYQINGLCAGQSYQVKIYHSQCDTIQKIITPTQSFSLNFFPEHHTEELKSEVIVLGEKKRKKALDVALIDQKIIENQRTKTIAAVLENEAGMRTLSTGGAIAKPMLHGLHSDRLLMLNNGIRQEDQQWGVEHAPTMDLNAFDQFSIVKGANTIRYSGDAVGGVVLAEPKKLLQKDTLAGKVSTQLASNGRLYGIHGFVEKGFSKNLAFNTNLSYKKSGDYKTPDYYLTNTGQQQLAFSTQIGFQRFQQGISAYYSYIKAENGILRASHIGNMSDLYYAIQQGKPAYTEDFSYDINLPKQEIQHHLVSLKAYQRFRNWGKLDFQYAYQHNERKEYDLRIGENKNRPAMDLRLNTHSATLSLEKNNRNTIDWQMGISALYQKNFPNPDTGVKPIIPDYQKYNAGIYGLVHYKPSAKISLEAGLRYDFNQLDAKKYYTITQWEASGYNKDFSNFIIKKVDNQYLTNPVFKYHTYALSAGIHWKINPNHEVSLQYGSTNRPPNAAELFSDGLHHSAAVIEIGSLYLKEETAHKISIDYQGKTKGEQSFEWHLNPYFQTIQNFITEIPTGAALTVRGAFPVWSYQQTNALLTGFDIRLKWNCTENIAYETDFSYLYGQDTQNNQPLILMPAPTWRNRLHFNVLKNMLSIHLNHQYTAKQNRFPITNFTMEFIEDGASITRTVDISTPPDAYHLLGLGAEWQFKVKNQKFQLNASIDNLFDTQYRDYLNRLRYYADEQGRNISLGIQYSF